MVIYFNHQKLLLDQEFSINLTLVKHMDKEITHIIKENMEWEVNKELPHLIK